MPEPNQYVDQGRYFFLGVLIVVFLIILSGCESTEENQAQSENKPDKRIYIKKEHIQSFPVNFESIPAKPDIIKAKAPVIKSASRNLLDIKISDSTRIEFNFKDLASYPKKLSFTWEHKELNYPQPVKALKPAYKDMATFNIKYLDIDQGMNSSYIATVYEDKNGNIWMGTAGGGVSMYNGEEFFHYTNESGLNTFSVYDIVEDKNGSIWFAAYSGEITTYDGVSFRFLQIENIENISVYDLLRDSENNIWIATEKNGVLKYTGDEMYQYTTVNGLSADRILSLEEDDKGRIWIGTAGGGINILDQSRIAELSGDISNNVIWDMEFGNENMWIVSEKNGFYNYRNDYLFHYDNKSGLPSNYFISILIDSRDRVWLGSYGKGIIILDSGEFNHITESQGLSLDYIWSITEDSFGNVWIGTDGGGVSIYCKQTFYNFNDTNGLPNSFVFSTIQDHEENFWFGTFGGGISKFDGDTFNNYSIDQGLPSKFINDLFIDSKNRLWIGSQDNGLVRFENGYFYHYHTKNGLTNNNIRSIGEDDLGRIWIGTEGGGLLLLKDDELMKVTGTPDINSAKVKSIVSSKSGEILIGTDDQGLLVYDQDTFQQYTDKTGLPTNDIFSLYIDPFGVRWLGTIGSGLIRMDEDTFTIIDKDSGLSHNSVWTITGNSDDGLWVGTERGLNHLTFNENQVHIETFRKRDGLMSEGFFLNSAYFDTQGRYWFGSDKSLVLFDKKKLVEITEDPLPRVKLTNLLINQQFYDYRSSAKESLFSYDSVSEYSNVPLGLELNHSQNHLTFYFNAIDWSSPHDLAYSYKLEGLNDYWSVPGSESKADYRNLPGGSFTFSVKAVDRSGQWSKPIDYSFVIFPPWWKTWWAWVIYITIGGLLIVGYIRLRLSNLKKSRARLQSEVEKATKELELSNAELVAINDELMIQRKELEQLINDLEKTQQQLIASEKMASLGVLSSGIAHEINNPLNYIQGGIYGITEYFKEHPENYTDEMKELVSAMKEGVLRANKIVRSLSLFTKKSKSKNEICDIHEILEDCLLILANQIKNRIEIVKLFASYDLRVKGNHANLYQAFLQILTNAEQAIESEGLITVKTILKGKNVLVSVKDTGSGISKENINRISDPFFTTKDPNMGTGLGLTIAQNTFHDHQGTIEFVSKEGQGTEVIVKIPVYIPS